MVEFVKKSAKRSLLTMLQKADKITPRLLARMFEGVLFKDEFEIFSAGGGLDHGNLAGLTDDDHVRYIDKDGTRELTADWDAGPHEIRAETLESDVATGTAPLTVASTTLVDNLNADMLDGNEAADIDYSFVSGNDAATDVTAAELEELTDESTTTLHSHAVNQQVICFSSYIDKKERAAAWNFHGGIVSLDTGSALDSVPTDITVTAGIGKLMVVVNAGSDIAGEITVTGTSVDRNTGAETASDTDTLTVDALTTDGSDTDAQGNTRHSFTGAYITSKWFKGSVTLSTTNLTLTDVDTYQVAFEQVNDNPDVEMTTADLTAYATNASAWMYGYLYTLEVTGDKCDVTRQGSLELPTADVSANTFYRIRRGNLGVEFDGTTDGFWADVFPGPLANSYWEDINVKFWFAIGEGDTTVTGYTISGTVTDSGGTGIGGVTISLTGDASDSTATASDGTYSFTNVPNGSYTVTPTKTDLYFSPTSTLVTVSNGHQISKDFSGYLVLPYSYVISSEVSESSGAVAGQLSDWTIYTGKTDATIITSNLADSNSFTPSGGTKGFEFDYGDRIIHDLPAAVVASSDGIRVAFLAYAVEVDRAMLAYMYDVTAAQLNAGSPAADGILGNAFDLNATPDTNTSTAKYDAATAYNEHNATGTGVDVGSGRYHWYRWEWNWGTSQVNISVVRDEDDSTIYTSSQSMNAAGVSLGNAPAGLKILDIGPIHNTSTIRLVKFWIGETTDSWPTS